MRCICIVDLPTDGVTANGTTTQPIRWSREFYDEELGLVYYNYRRYNPTDGRWINRDPIGEEGGHHLFAFAANNGIGQWDILGLSPSRREIERLTREVKALLKKVEECFRRRSEACCAELYARYLSLLAELVQKAGEFYGDQLWITDRDEQAMWEVFGLPTIVGGKRLSAEELKRQKEAAEKAREQIQENIFNKYGDEIDNGVNFGSGLSDSLSLGTSRWLSTLVNGGKSRWGDTTSGMYQAGLWTGTAIWTLSGSGGAIGRYGANSSLVGKASYLFGRSKYGPKGILNSGPVRLGWSWKKKAGKEVFRLSWSPRNKGSFWNHLDF